MTPREPDRYTNAEWQRAARILDACLNGSHEHDEGGLVLAAESWRPIAAALRAAESSALERAARIARRYSHHAEREIRALIPPAAAPAADSALESMCDCGRHVEGEKYALPAGGHVRAAHVDAPAAETGKAQGADLLTLLRDLFGYIEDGTLVRNTACDAQPGWAPKAMKLVMTLKRVQEAIAARAAQSEEPTK